MTGFITHFYYLSSNVFKDDIPELAGIRTVFTLYKRTTIDNAGILIVLIKATKDRRSTA